jgi:hypothetical protein
MTALYDTDFYLWTQDQAALLGARDADALDFENLAEEIRSLGASDRRELPTRLYQLVLHLLKWQYQPQRRVTGRSWRSSIREQRRRLAMVLRESPSLRRTVPEVLMEEYPYAREAASDETGLPLTTFPEACLWTAEEVLDVDFWPEA